MIAHLDVRSVVNIAFRQMWKFLLVFIPILFIGLAFIFLSTRQYESNAKLLVKFGQDARPEVSINSGYQSGLSAEEKRGLVLSNVNILASRDIAQTLLEKITIEKVYPDIQKEDVFDDIKMTYAIKSLQKDLEIETESDAGVIKINFFNKDAQISQIVLKELISLFLEKQSEVFGNPQMDVLREQADISKQKLDEATQKLYDFKTESGIASIDEELTLLLQQRGDFAGYMSRRAVGTTGINNQNNFSALPAQLSKSGDTSRLPVVEDKQKKIDELKSKEAELLLTYKPDSQVIKNIRKNIAIEESGLNKAVEALNNQIQDLDYQIAQKQKARVTYDELSREVALLDDAFKIAQSRLQAAEVNNDLNQRKITRISVIEEPSLPIKPSKPNKIIILILTLLFATSFGAALAFAIEILDSSFNRPEQLSRALSKPVLASFANWSKERTYLKRLPKGDEWKHALNNHIKQRTLPSPFYKIKPDATNINQVDILGLYQAIETHIKVSDKKIIQITSCYVGEGSTTVATALASFCASSLGKETLIIGHDNKGSRKTGNLPMPMNSIIDVAQGRAAIKDAIVTTDNHNVAYAYLCPNNQYETILSNIDKIDQVLKELQKSFSVIVIPTPAVLSNPASLSLSKMSDGVIVVVEAERTRSPVVKQVLENIKDKGGNVIGFVLNKYTHYIPTFIYKHL